MSDQPKEKAPGARVTLWLPEELVERAKIEAIKRKTSVSKMVARLLEQEVPKDDPPRQYATA